MQNASVAQDTHCLFQYPQWSFGMLQDIARVYDVERSAFKWQRIARYTDYAFRIQPICDKKLTGSFERAAESFCVPLSAIPSNSYCLIHVARLIPNPEPISKSLIPFKGVKFLSSLPALIGLCKSRWSRAATALGILLTPSKNTPTDLSANSLTESGTIIASMGRVGIISFCSVGIGSDPSQYMLLVKWRKS
jgi:hypothetical protein